ncbi:hypothetical protein OS493_022182 [Desmophyllum pertusum]|uniref:Uncharacterized protein n=1 Tax=Desmophyllum pertusum TaxID=174260 RepID=A0A9W9YAN1_9CNID|nr:hypothetical protein OS493_022182 [Desmophyllum pertusum]
MKPVNHLFMMRLKIQLHNTHINSAFREKIENTFSVQAGHAVETELDIHGRLLLRSGNTRFIQKRPYQSSNHSSSPSSPAVSPASIPTEEQTPFAKPFHHTSPEIATSSGGKLSASSKNSPSSSKNSSSSEAHQ